MHTNLTQILKRANRALLDAHHEGKGDPERILLAWKKLNPVSRIESRTWPGAPLPVDLDGEESAAAARLLATALGMRLFEARHLREGLTPTPEDLLFIRGAEEEDPDFIATARQAAPSAGFFMDACVRKAVAPPGMTPTIRPGAQRPLF